MPNAPCLLRQYISRLDDVVNRRSLSSVSSSGNLVMFSRNMNVSTLFRIRVGQVKLSMRLSARLRQ